MRFWIKIVVSLSVVVVIAFGVWAFFFREKEDVVAYNDVCEVINYKESLGLAEKLNSLRDRDYTGDEKTKVYLDSESEAEKGIINIRESTLSLSDITYYDEGGNLTCIYKSYYVMEELTDECIEYLLPFLKFENLKSRELKDIQKAVSSTISNLKKFDESILLVVDNQVAITECTDIEYEILLGKYKGYNNAYRELLNSSASLVVAMIEGIQASTDNFKIDTDIALMDSFARQLQISTSVNQKEEPYFAYDVYHIMNKYIEHNKSHSIFTTEYTEYKFLTSYNTLMNNYSDVLSKIFSKSNLEKKKMADGENLSDIVKDAQNSVTTLLNVLGF